MDVYSFVEGPLLRATFAACVIGVLIRSVLFLSVMLMRIVNGVYHGSKWKYVLGILARLPIPFHKAALKKPVYSVLRYIFHICLFVVPIWFSGHIVMWEESSYEWSWTPLSDEWIEWMTLILLALAAFFLLRRMISSNIRSGSFKSDYIFVIITAMPFLTGYFLTNGTLDAVPFLGSNMWTIHILSGEVMLLMALFLFCGVRLKVKTCTGCAACELSCPTGALECSDEGQLRVFNYDRYICIRCGGCVLTCPEGAAELRHVLSVKRFFQLAAQPERKVELERCEVCGLPFIPGPQLAKLEGIMAERDISLINLKTCGRCKGLSVAKYIRQR